MWRKTQLPEQYRWLTSFNPFQSFLDIVREPLLGHLPSLLAWKVVLVVTIGGYAMATFIFSRFRARIVFWL